MYQIGKRVLGDNSGPSERSYRIEFDEQGRIRSYTGRRGRHTDEGLAFYPNGGISNFWAEIDRQTTGQATWYADGRLQSEGMSPQLPRDTAGLPELENVLRHGSDAKKFEAIAAMAEIGSASIPYALKVLEDGDELSRERAAFLFVLFAARAFPASSSLATRVREDAVPTLMRRLQEDESPKVRQGIAHALGMGPWGEAAIPALEEAATNANPEVANAARIALERIRGSPSK
ncbi:MAG TPA: HEAT repeat domain-containing protein [Verrucomicrobiae bacterium]|nr:HEAT repeat domain-containing protein [Verrucomicrobiae bacterium]